MSNEMFPIMPQTGTAPHPMTVPWSVAEKAYSVYAARYGTNQSLRRLAERGGFGAREMDEFLPGWREEASENAALLARLDLAEADRRELAESLREAVADYGCHGHWLPRARAALAAHAPSTDPPKGKQP